MAIRSSTEEVMKSCKPLGDAKQEHIDLVLGEGACTSNRMELGGSNNFVRVTFSRPPFNSAARVAQ